MEKRLRYGLSPDRKKIAKMVFAKNKGEKYQTAFMIATKLTHLGHKIQQRLCEEVPA